MQNWCKRLTAAGLLALSLGSTALAQAGDQPQTPGGGGGSFVPEGEKQKFPGPRGSQFTFPTGLYDENIDPAKQVAEGVVRAKRDGKRVLVMWGENMCGFCVFLNDLIKHDPKIEPLVKSEYDWIKIDLGPKFTKNVEFAKFYGVDLWTPFPDPADPAKTKQLGAPALCVIDPDTGRGVGTLGGNFMTAQPMTMTRVFDENKIYEFLWNNRAPAKAAQSLMNDAMTGAKSNEKKVLAYFTMPLCETCDKAWAWMSRADVSGVLGKAFAVARIDTERTIGGRDLLVQASGSKAAMAPHLVLTDAAGATLAHQSLFAGMPRTDAEIDAFVAVLAKAAPSLTDADKGVLVKSLKDEAMPKADAKPADTTAEKK